MYKVVDKQMYEKKIRSGLTFPCNAGGVYHHAVIHKNKTGKTIAILRYTGTEKVYLIRDNS